MRGWNYRSKYLRGVAENYKDYSIYKFLSPPSPNVDRNPTRLRYDKLSTKIDFDRALDVMGRGHWSGTGFGDGAKDNKFKTYRSFGRLQQVVIADIIGITDGELEQVGFYDIERLRGWAYGAMSSFLAAHPNQFVRKSLDKRGII